MTHLGSPCLVSRCVLQTKKRTEGRYTPIWNRHSDAACHQVTVQHLWDAPWRGCCHTGRHCWNVSCNIATAATLCTCVCVSAFHSHSLPPSCSLSLSRLLSLSLAFSLFVLAHRRAMGGLIRMALLSKDPLRAGVSIDINTSYLRSAKEGEELLITGT